MSPAPDLPDLAQVLAQLLQRVPREQQPLLIALAERMAADRYRAWADGAADATRCAGLRACAAREDDIAGRVEALYPDAAAIQADILGRNPDLPARNRALFAPHPIDQQLALQARGERVGAATWRAFARHESGDDRRETFLACARLEEENATFLEAVLDEGVA
jgi:hypothetical protein